MEKLIEVAAWNVVRLYNSKAEDSRLRDAMDILRLALLKVEEQTKTSDELKAFLSKIGA